MAKVGGSNPPRPTNTIPLSSVIPNPFNEDIFIFGRRGIRTNLDACGAIDTVLTPVEIAFFSIDIPFTGTRIIGSTGGSETGGIVH